VALYIGADLDLDREVTNRPNPFAAGREQTTVLFRAEQTGTVNIVFYTLHGDVVFQAQRAVTAGAIEQFVWDGRNGKGRVVGNGGYLCRIHGAGLDLKRKIAVVK
jgi:flagellar hook assembly protein FlgD